TRPTPTGEPMSGADVLVQSLIRHGVGVVFAYPGGASMPIHQSLTRVTDRLRTILPRHEQGGGFMAHGYARTTGKVGVCIATSGRPGPVIVDVPKDVQIRKVVPDWDAPMNLPGYRPFRRPKREELEPVLAAVRASKKPFIYAGGGVTHSGAAEELRRFAELTG